MHYYAGLSQVKPATDNPLFMECIINHHKIEIHYAIKIGYPALVTDKPLKPIFSVQILFKR